MREVQYDIFQEGTHEDPDRPGAVTFDFGPDERPDDWKVGCTFVNLHVHMRVLERLSNREFFIERLNQSIRGLRDEVKRLRLLTDDEFNTEHRIQHGAGLVETLAEALHDLMEGNGFELVLKDLFGGDDNEEDSGGNGSDVPGVVGQEG